MEEMLYMGHDAKYWIELEKQARSLNVTHLIEELAKAHGKVGFYENRIKEMSELMGK